MPSILLSTGINVYYEEQGEGEPLLFISGAGADHNAWILQKDEFSKHFRVITFDNRGTGASDCPRERADYSVPILAADAAALMNALNIEQAHIIGQSLGSAVAQEIAIAFPEKVRSLLLLVTWGKSDVRIKAICNTMSTLISRISFYHYFHYVYALAFSTALLETRPDFVEVLYEDSMKTGLPKVEGMLGQWHAVYHHDTSERLKKIEAPSLIVAGESDVLIPPAYCRKVARSIPGARLHLLTGELASHLLHIEMAPIFNQLALDFLQKGEHRGVATPLPGNQRNSGIE